MLHHFFNSLLATLVPLYATFFWAVHFYQRYTIPLLCVILPFLAVIFSALMTQIRRQGIVFCAFLLVLMVSFAFHSWGTLHTGVIEANTHSVTAGFIRENFDKNVRIAAFQSGVIGYYNDNIINLDGKVNSQALKALQTKTLDRYIDMARIDVMIDWPESFLHSYLGERWLSGWQPCAKQPANYSVCLVRKGTGKQ